MKINQLEHVLKANNIDPSSYNDLLAADYNNSSSPESLQADPIMSMTNKFGALLIKENKILHSGSTSYITFINSDKQLADIFSPYIKKHSNNYETFKASQNVRAVDVMNEPHAFEPEWLSYKSASAINTCDLSSFSLESPTKANIAESKLMFEIITNINKVIPPLYVVHTLVDNFFKHVYPIFPYINEEIFKEELELVLIPLNGGGCKVELTHFQNASIISLLLIVLRFSYLTINVRDIKDNFKEIDNEILAVLVNSGFKIEHTFILYAKTLLMSLPSNDTIFRKVTLRNIQTLLYLRLYQSYSPELNEESAEHSITLALLIQMSHVLGANLDPSRFSNFYKDDRIIILWRRIYHKLLALDAISAFNYATPLIINESEWSTKLPKLSDEEMRILNAFRKKEHTGNSLDEIKKIAIENSINSQIAVEYEFYKLAREGLSIFQNFTNTNKKSQYISVVKKIEDFLDNNIPSFYEIMNESENSSLEKMFNISKIKLFEIRLMLSSFLQTFYYLLYLNEFDSESDDVYTFALKATEMAMILFKIGYDYARYMNQSGKVYGNTKSFKKFKVFSHNLECYIFNVTQTVYQRSILWISSMFMRNLVDNSITIENLMKDFGNRVDSSVVLSWFNVNIKSAEDQILDNKELMILIFNYTKDLFLMLHHLKGEYFVAWRNSTVIQLFLNKFKIADEQSCQNFMSCDISNALNEANVSTFSDSMSGPFMPMEDGSSNEVSPYTIESSLSNKTPNSGADLGDIDMTSGPKGLFYDNVDSLIDDIFTGNEERATLFKKFDLFDTRDFNSNDPLEGFMDEFGSTPQMDPKHPSIASHPSTSSGVTNGSSRFSQLTPGTNPGISVVTPSTEEFINSLKLSNTPNDGNQLLEDFEISSMNNGDMNIIN